MSKATSTTVVNTIVNSLDVVHRDGHFSARRTQAERHRRSHNGIDNCSTSWKREIYYCVVCIIGMFLAFSMAACKITAENPVDIIVGSEVDTSPFLGEWDIVEMAGLDRASIGIPVTPISNSFKLIMSPHSSGGLVATYTAENQSQAVELPVSLTSVNGDIIASIAADDSWYICKIIFYDNTNRLEIRFIASGIVKDEIRSSGLMGEIQFEGTDAELVTITAPGPQIRDFIETTPSSFDENAALVFERTVPIFLANNQANKDVDILENDAGTNFGLSVALVVSLIIILSLVGGARIIRS